jgi:hypothetical protein
VGGKAAEYPKRCFLKSEGCFVVYRKKVFKQENFKLFQLLLFWVSLLPVGWMQLREEVEGKLRNFLGSFLIIFYIMQNLKLFGNNFHKKFLRFLGFF